MLKSLLAAATMSLAAALTLPGEMSTAFDGTRYFFHAMESSHYTNPAGEDDAIFVQCWTNPCEKTGEDKKHERCSHISFKSYDLSTSNGANPNGSAGVDECVKLAEYLEAKGLDCSFTSDLIDLDYN